MSDSLDLAKLVYKALRTVSPNSFIQGEPDGEGTSVIDGQFDLIKVAEIIIQAEKDNGRR